MSSSPMTTGRRPSTTSPLDASISCRPCSRRRRGNRRCSFPSTPWPRRASRSSRVPATSGTSTAMSQDWTARASACASGRRTRSPSSSGRRRTASASTRSPTVTAATSSRRCARATSTSPRPPTRARRRNSPPSPSSPRRRCISPSTRKSRSSPRASTRPWATFSSTILPSSARSSASPSRTRIATASS